MVATVVFLASFIGGFIMAMIQNADISSMLFATELSVRFGLDASGGFSPTSTIGYFVHNSSITIGTWLMGFSIVGPFIILFENAMNISQFVAEGLLLWSSGNPQGLWMLAFLIPHAFLELGAVMIASGAGIFLGSVVVDDVFRGSSRISYVNAVKQTLPVIGLAIALLIVAAFVESTISPQFADMVVEVVT